ncbi:strawberry notch family protein, partial [Azospirillum sp. B4]|uniref:strawberry notch family protein n=1 Tax=Azospirillum sp. B4 TaxID=95605 RepID=UPI0019026F0D
MVNDAPLVGEFGAWHPLAVKAAALDFTTRLADRVGRTTAVGPRLDAGLALAGQVADEARIITHLYEAVHRLGEWPRDPVETAAAVASGLALLDGLQEIHYLTHPEGTALPPLGTQLAEAAGTLAGEMSTTAADRLRRSLAPLLDVARHGPQLVAFARSAAAVPMRQSQTEALNLLSLIGEPVGIRPGAAFSLARSYGQPSDPQRLEGNWYRPEAVEAGLLQASRLCGGPMPDLDDLPEATRQALEERLAGYAVQPYAVGVPMLYRAALAVANGDEPSGRGAIVDWMAGPGRYLNFTGLSAKVTEFLDALPMSGSQRSRVQTALAPGLAAADHWNMLALAAGLGEPGVDGGRLTALQRRLVAGAILDTVAAGPAGYSATLQGLRELDNRLANIAPVWWTFQRRQQDGLGTVPGQGKAFRLQSANGALSPSERDRLVDTIASHLRLGGTFESLADLREHAMLSVNGSGTGTVGTERPPARLADRDIQEAAEAALVQVAGEAVATLDDGAALKAVIDLQGRLPSLNHRTSASIQLNQYSTPLPLALLVSRLAGLRALPDGSTIGEPTAGNGALLFEAPKGAIRANEIDPVRRDQLRAAGIQATAIDALTGQVFPDKSLDRLVANPPFGTLAAPGQSSPRYEVTAGDGLPFASPVRDHVISLRSLEALRDDGVAVLIVRHAGSPHGPQDDDTLTRAYAEPQQRAFWATLHARYNVARHVTIDGGLYRSQGAGWPVDLVVIEGRKLPGSTGNGATAPLPMAVPPQRLSTWSQVEEFLHEYGHHREGPATVARLAGNDGASAASPLDAGDGSDLGPASVVTPAEAGSTGPDRGQPAGAGQSPGLPAPGNPELVGNLGHRASSVLQAGNEGIGPASGRSGVEDPVMDDVRPPGGTEDQAATDGNGRAGGDGGRDGGRYADLAALPADRLKERPKGPSTAQVPYLPLSQGPRMGMVMPRSLAKSTHKALARVRQRYGDVDAFVADALGFSSKEALWEVVGAEQIDTYALNRLARERGGAFINGKQTGGGKGRDAALEFREAQREGRPFVLVTEGPHLYRDFMRDLADVGVGPVNALVTNSDLKGQNAIPLDDGRDLATPKDHDQLLAEVARHGRLPQGFDLILTSYPQLQTIAGRDTLRRSAMRSVAPDAFIHLSESHEAAGTADKQQRGPAKGDQPDRAAFIRTLVSRAGQASFDSATYAKRAGVLDLYARTALGKVPGGLEALAHGGVPLQQAAAALLAEGGEYLRLERSFDGVKFRSTEVPVDDMLAAQLSECMAAIAEFDREKGHAVDRVERRLRATARAMGKDSALDCGSINFTALMHNVVAQGLLALKADHVADQALRHLGRDAQNAPLLDAVKAAGGATRPAEDWQDLLLQAAGTSREVLTGISAAPLAGRWLDALQGQIAGFDQVQVENLADALEWLDHKAESRDRLLMEGKTAGGVPADDLVEYLGPWKPVVALANTMGSFLEAYTEDMGLQPGDNVGADFRDLLLRYLDRSRDIMVGSPYGEKDRHHLSDDDLGSAAADAWQRARDLILNSDLGRLPISPIDWIEYRLADQGYVLGEATGRGLKVDYSGRDGDGAPVGTLGRRAASAIGKAGVVRVTNAFNDGTVDALVMNESGAT